MGGVVKDVVGGIGDIVEEGLGAIGGVVSEVPGLDSLGKEIERWGEDANQVMKVVSGEYHKDVKKVEDYQKKVEKYGEQYGDKTKDYNNGVNRLMDKMSSLIAFHEIFQMALGNRLDKFHADYSPELAKMDAEYAIMVDELKRMVAKIESEYDFVIGLTEGPFLQRIIGSVIMIIGGLMNDLNDIASGKADSKVWGRIGMVIVLVIVIVIAILFPPAWALVAATGAFTATYMVIIGLMILSAFMSLDGMYSNGAATGAIMGLLDGIFNDILNLDDLIGSDFEKFDKDHEDYSQMVGYVQLAISLTTAYLAWSSSSAYYAGLESSKTAAINSTPLMSMAPTSGAGGNALATASGQMTQQTIGSATTSGIGSTTQYLGGAVEIGSSAADSKLFGVTFSTYSDIYDAFSSAIKVKDYISANKHYEDMKNKFEQDKEKVNTAIESKINKSMMKHYKDTAYFLQDQQEQIDSYIWSMTAANMYVDPYGTTPVANIRFTPDKDTRGLGFGFEDMFDESMLAGSRNYFNSIIYGS